MGLSDWDDRLTRALVKPPFRDELGRKGWLEPFSRAPPHRVRRLQFRLESWPQFPRPLRIAFLADFHVGSQTGDVDRLTAIIAEAAAFKADLALYGGDFVNMMAFGGGRVPPHTIAAILARLPAPLGRFAVTGNHDRNYDVNEVTSALRAVGIVVLADEQRSITVGNDAIIIAGIPDARVERPQAYSLLASLEPDRPAIVLAHDPFWFAHLPPGPHLMLAGHTHGGQIRLPLIGPLRNASRAPMRWTYGPIEEGGKRMYVTSGLGCSGIPLRLGVPPEYVLIETTAA